MKRVLMAAGIAAALLGGCEDAPMQPLAEARPATGEALDGYAKDATEIVRLGHNGDLVQRFCVNMTGALCAEGMAEQLKTAGFSGEGPANELGDAFAKLEADRLDGSADLASTDEIYVKALYRVVLAREPDAGGEASNLKFLKSGNGRVSLVRAFMQSPEFRGLS